MAGNTNAGRINKGHSSQFLNGLVHTHHSAGIAVGITGIAMRWHILCQNHEATASQFHKVQILEALVIKHTVAGDNSGSRGLCSSCFRNEQPCVHGVTVCGNPVDLFDLHGTEIGLDHAGKDAGQEHQNNADPKEYISFISFFHCVTLPSLCSSSNYTK